MDAHGGRPGREDMKTTTTSRENANGPASGIDRSGAAKAGTREKAGSEQLMII